MAIGAVSAVVLSGCSSPEPVPRGSNPQDTAFIETLATVEPELAKAPDDEVVAWGKAACKRMKDDFPALALKDVVRTHGSEIASEAAVVITSAYCPESKGVAARWAVKNGLSVDY